jgi:AcrR family transcriptional regulator
MGANPKTTAFLKECLADALIKLLETKPMEKITITEIAKLAGVGRTTYFRNFKSKEEMLFFKLILLWERWVEEHSIEKEKYFNAGNTLTFFQFNYSIRPLLELMYSRNLQSALFRSFYDYLMPKNSSLPIDCYESSFYLYGLFGLLDEWITRGFKETPEQMNEIVMEL